MVEENLMKLDEQDDEEILKALDRKIARKKEQIAEEEKRAEVLHGLRIELESLRKYRVAVRTKKIYAQKKRKKTTQDV